MKKYISIAATVLLGATLISGASQAAVADPNTTREQKEKPAQALTEDAKLAEMKEKAQMARKLIVAKVNDSEISMYDLIRKMNQIAPKLLDESAPITDEATTMVKQKALNRLIFEELAVQQAIAQGIEPAPEKIEKVIANVRMAYGSDEQYQAYLDKFDFTDEILRDRILRGHRLELITAREIYGKVKVDDEDIKKLYEEMKEDGRLRKADEYIAKDVVLFKGETEEDTKKRAQELRTEIKELDNDLGRLMLDGTFIVRRLVVDKEKYPEIFKTMDSMTVGELSEVIKDNETYHIVKVVKKEKARDLTLDEARGFIENRLRVPEQDDRRAKWEEELRQDAKIEILLDEVEKELQNKVGNAEKALSEAPAG